MLHEAHGIYSTKPENKLIHAIFKILVSTSIFINYYKLAKATSKIGELYVLHSCAAKKTRNIIGMEVLQSPTQCREASWVELEKRLLKFYRCSECHPLLHRSLE